MEGIGPENPDIAIALRYGVACVLHKLRVSVFAVQGKLSRQFLFCMFLFFSFSSSLVFDISKSIC